MSHKETLQQKVDRLNGYHLNGHDWLFDRLFASLKRKVEQAGKQLVCREGSYRIEKDMIKDAVTTMHTESVERTMSLDWMARERRNA